MLPIADLQELNERHNLGDIDSEALGCAERKCGLENHFALEGNSEITAPC